MKRKRGADVQSEWEIARIEGKRLQGLSYEYLVKWVGFRSSKNTWEPVAKLDGAKALFGRRVGGAAWLGLAQVHGELPRPRNPHAEAPYCAVELVAREVIGRLDWFATKFNVDTICAALVARPRGMLSRRVCEKLIMLPSGSARVVVAAAAIDGLEKNDEESRERVLEVTRIVAIRLSSMQSVGTNRNSPLAAPVLSPLARSADGALFSNICAEVATYCAMKLAVGQQAAQQA
ncbi:hypothetical protein T492DRAFT_1126074 [Pavlovales sp. CCMP2436]|nr:hypothetical protein T492DRAFT_1126074 [Pavlovales sp. CCMP2436]